MLNRMKQEGKDSHEYGLLYDYLDFVTSLSWKKEETVDVNLEEAEKILDREHYGLKKVKQRVIQQMAVMALNRRQSGSILLFVGAPGTGKTVSDRVLQKRCIGSMCVSVWAACGMKRRFAGTEELMWAPCRAGLWKE